jgi:hypothetical protein
MSTPNGNGTVDLVDALVRSEMTNDQRGADGATTDGGAGA